MKQDVIAEIQISYSNKIPISNRKKIRSSNDAHNLLIELWDKNLLELQEEFKLVLLNNANDVIAIYPMSKGGTTATIVDIKLLFAIALKCNASGIILAHNHPSGNIKPSLQDIELTQKIKQGGELLEVKLLDHLILAKTNYYSFADDDNI